MLKLKKEYIYYFMVCCVALTDGLSASMLYLSLFGKLKYILLLGFLLCAVTLLVTTKMRFSTGIALGAMTVLGMYTVFVLNTNAILYMVLLAFLGREYDIEKTVKIVLVIIGGIFATHFIVFIFEYIFNRGAISYLDWYDLKRYYIYYDHPNNAARYLLFIIAMLTFSYFDKIKNWHWLIIFSIIGILYYFTRSESIFITVFIFIFAVFKKNNLIKRFVNFFSRYGMIIIAAISTMLGFNIKIPVLSNLLALFDGIGSGRFSNLHRAVDTYGITLFGQEALFGNAEVMGNYSSLFADNLTVYSMTCLGYIYIFILCALFFIAAKKMNYKEQLFVCIFVIFSFIENRVLSIECYIIIIVAVNAMFRKKEIHQLTRSAKQIVKHE